MGPPPAAKRRITQDAFDAAVAENMEEFGMDAEEALAEAVAGLQLQGVDLSNVRTTLPEAGGRLQLRAVDAVAALVAAQANAGAPAGVVSALAALAAELAGPDMQPDAVQAAGRAGGVDAVLQAVQAFASQGDAGTPGLLQALATLKALLAETDTRDAFVARGGAATVANTALASEAPPAVVAAGARACSAAAARHEDAKVALVKAGAAPMLVAALQAHAGDAAVAAAASWALAALATADDRRSSASAAFSHGRLLHKLSAHTPLMAALRTHARAPGAAAAVCSALRAAAVNDEACVEVADAGGVEAAVALLQPPGEAAPGVVRSALSLLRQLAGADAVKPRFVAAAGLPALLSLLCERRGPPAAQAPLCEAGLALLSALTLRNPEGAAAAAAAGGLDVATDVMAAFPAAPGLQRAACMYLRNSAARNLELRPAMLERGAEALLRAAKAAHPAVCTDVGSAALRDLGAENYNEGWNPTTVYMGASGELYTYDELGNMDDPEEEPASSVPSIAEE